MIRNEQEENANARHERIKLGKKEINLQMFVHLRKKKWKYYEIRKYYTHKSMVNAIVDCRKCVAIDCIMPSEWSNETENCKW